jgi:hypothetical protein
MSMKKRTLGITMAAAFTVSVPAQVVGGRGIVGIAVPTQDQQFQQARTIGSVTVVRKDVDQVFQDVLTLSGAQFTGAGRTNPPVPLIGRPVSATEEQRSLQTLADGTEISTSASDLYYRDSQGRERVERTSGGETTITIVDRVAQFTADLDPSTKTARRTNRPMINLIAVAALGRVAASSAGGRGGRGGRGGPNNTVFEDLGVASINGVTAAHTRSTLTIPQGQIGNNRDIHVVNERWYSEDLQMLVKSVNSDPRFGENTYELTNISRSEPDASLFQIPAGFTIVEMPSGQGAQQTTPRPVIK